MLGGQLTKPPVDKSVFPDVQAMKEKVRLATAKHEYDVAEFYWDTGCCQWIARHPFFEYTTLMVIMFNSLWLSIDADNNDEPVLKDAPLIFQVTEYSFCAYFTLEWILRFAAFRHKTNSVKDLWFL
jgi:mannose-1-phosphate guanylyltransferase